MEFQSNFVNSEHSHKQLKTPEKKSINEKVSPIFTLFINLPIFKYFNQNFPPLYCKICIFQLLAFAVRLCTFAHANVYFG